MYAKIVAICKSNKKGTKKRVINVGLFKKNYGLVGDIHAGHENERQVSLLGIESIKEMQKLGLNVGPGDFAENLTTEGIELTSLIPGTKLFVGNEVVLEITKLGKECHIKCDVFQKTGKCIMPKKGVFAKVVDGGIVKIGDEIKVSMMDRRE